MKQKSNSVCLRQEIFVAVLFLPLNKKMSSISRVFSDAESSFSCLRAQQSQFRPAEESLDVPKAKEKKKGGGVAFFVGQQFRFRAFVQAFRASGEGE